ncbi:hypothetical protein Y032_0549g3297 [Ancylostoma ceylanicum]|nr:hypothetical protein Y032_0549g3297 [Ancylostoma ceylanicum]
MKRGTIEMMGQSEQNVEKYTHTFFYMGNQHEGVGTVQLSTGSSYEYKCKLVRKSVSAAAMVAFYVLVACLLVLSQSAQASFDHGFDDFDHGHGHGLGFGHHFPGFHSFWGGWDDFPFKNRKAAKKAAHKHKGAHKKH